MSQDNDTPDVNIVRRQQHLMDLLESVELEGGDSGGDESIYESPPRECQGCGKFASWGSSSWCPDCGYYPKTGKSIFADNVRETLEQVDQQEILKRPNKTERSALIRQVSIIVSCLLISGLSGFFLIPQLADPEEGKTQVGVTSVEEVVAPIEIEPTTTDSSDQSTTEVVESTPPPEMTDPVVLASDRIPLETPEPEVIETIEPVEKTPELITTSEKILPDKEVEKEYLIFGYSTNQKGEIRSILLAAEGEEGSGRYYFGGKFSLSTRDQDFLVKLQETLDSHRVPEPAMRNPFIARWSRPLVSCTLHHNGTTPDGRILEGQLVSFLVPVIPEIPEEEPATEEDSTGESPVESESEVEKSVGTADARPTDSLQAGKTAEAS